MLKVILLASLVTFSAFDQPRHAPESESKAKSALAAAREADLAKAIEKQELRHYELHRLCIPMTQGNLQWLTAQIGARPDEALLVWKLMRTWDASRAESLAGQSDLRNPS